MSIAIIMTLVILTYLIYIMPADITVAILKVIGVTIIFAMISNTIMSCFFPKRYQKCLRCIANFELLVFPAAAPPTVAERTQAAKAEKRQAKRQKQDQMVLLRNVERTRIR